MKKMCKNCGIEFKTYGSGRKYCCKQCSDEGQTTRVEVPCDYCGEPLLLHPSRLNQSKYHFCNMKCRDLYRHNNGNYEEYNKKQFIKLSHVHKVNTETFCENCHKTIMTPQRFCSQKCSQEFMIKENSPIYKPNIERINRNNVLGNKKWALTIKEQSDFKCDICNSSKELHSHHLESWASNKIIRLDLDNGICLCSKCHRKFHHDYGNKNNTKEQYEEFKELMHND